MDATLWKCNWKISIFVAFSYWEWYKISFGQNVKNNCFWDSKTVKIVSKRVEIYSKTIKIDFLQTKLPLYNHCLGPKLQLFLYEHIQVQTKSSTINQ